MLDNKKCRESGAKLSVGAVIFVHLSVTLTSQGNVVIASTAPTGNLKKFLNTSNGSPLDLQFLMMFNVTFMRNPLGLSEDSKC